MLTFLLNKLWIGIYDTLLNFFTIFDSYWGIFDSYLGTV